MVKIKKGNQQYNLNLEKQKFLRSKGVNVKLDGSWGPWLQRLYDKLKSDNKQNWFVRATIGAAMAENPAIMTASGWQLDKSGNWKQRRTPESDKLADNLAVLSTSSPTNPVSAAIEKLVGKVIIPAVSFGANKTKYLFSKGANGIIDYFRPDKYLTNGNWNVLRIKDEIITGRNAAVDYFNSDLRKQVINNNLQEAKLLGFSNYSPALNEAQLVKLSKYRAVLLPNEPWGGRTDGLDTEINIVSDDIENATFHESLHNGRLASTDSLLPNETYQLYLNRAKDTRDYFRYKTEQLLKPYKDIPENIRESYLYVELPYESAANYFELGRRLGLKPGQSYPGDDVVKRIIEYAPKTKELEYKAGLVNFVRPDRLQNFWKALTGQYYAVPLLGGFVGQQAISQTDKTE